MFSRYISSAVVALAASQLASAQTSTACNPLQKTCPDDPGFCSTVTIDFTKGSSSEFESLSTAVTYDKDKGALFQISKDTDSPTFRSHRYIMFGRVDAVIWAANGAGIVSSLVLQSDDLDEIDWEWVGGDGGHAQTNYFSKGDDSTYDRGATYPVSNALGQFHTYSIDWTKDRVQWIVDGAVLRTLNYADAKGGSTFPQTPMQIKLGTWVAGRQGEPQGTVNWAGGYTNFAQAPFNAWYKSITIQDYTSCPGGSVYYYGDHSGTYQSIKIKQGTGASTDGNSTSTTTTTSSSTSSAPTTMSTVPSSTSNSTSNKPTGTNAGTTTSAPASNSAPKSVANFAFMAAAAYLGYIAL